MVITAIGLLLVVATAIALSWPLLSPTSHPEERDREVDPSARLKSEKDNVLAAIREADFDHEVGKLSEEDYRSLRVELEERAVGALAALDRVASITPASPTSAVPPPSVARGGATFCPACVHRRKSDADFCNRCGRPLSRTTSSERRRRA